MVADDVYDFVVLHYTSSIATSAFAYSCVEKILFKHIFVGDYPSNIGEKAFENCESLTTVIFGELGKETIISYEENTKLKNVGLDLAKGDYTIQTDAFKGCRKLTTLVLPEVVNEYKLVIERDAFCGCEALRTIVALCDKIEFTGNPFPEANEHLTFICKENSEMARFACKNGYRSVYV